MSVLPAFIIVIPAVAAAVSFAISSNRLRPLLLPFVAVLHSGLTLTALARPTEIGLETWIGLDPLAKVCLLILSTLYLACALYAPGYLRLRPDRDNRVFCSCLLILLATMSTAVTAQHLGLIWVSIEATTLVSAPLIYFNKTPRAIEATWKYLLTCSVGIALALLGTFFIAFAAIQGRVSPDLHIAELLTVAPQLSRPWLETAFVVLLVGYGTKMGLAPMHTWKPDAYGEAPGIVGTLLSSGLTTCATLALMKVFMVMKTAGCGEHAGKILVSMGLFSMVVGSFFTLRQRDYKRMLAYSSIEHMGVIALGLGVGGLALVGALFHLYANALAKGALFLSSGNIHRAFGSKNADDVRGALKHLPFSSALFFAGFLATSGFPPFGPFVSEFTVLRGLLDSGRYGVAAGFLVCLFIAFIGMGATVLKMIHNDEEDASHTLPYRDTFDTVAPIALLLTLVIVLGIASPASFMTLLQDAATYVEHR